MFFIVRPMKVKVIVATKIRKCECYYSHKIKKEPAFFKDLKVCKGYMTLIHQAIRQILRNGLKTSGFISYYSY